METGNKTGGILIIDRGIMPPGEKIMEQTKRLIHAIAAIAVACFYCAESSCDGAVEVNVPDYFGLESEIETIRTAADRNGCYGEDFYILLAIRKAEDGRAGLEFGVMHHRAKDTNLDIQAGWSAATIMENRKRFAGHRPINSKSGQVSDKGKGVQPGHRAGGKPVTGIARPHSDVSSLKNRSGRHGPVRSRAETDAFIDFMGNRYCPASLDLAGNINWRHNVKYWTGKFKNQAVR